MVRSLHRKVRRVHVFGLTFLLVVSTSLQAPAVEKVADEQRNAIPTATQDGHTDVRIRLVNAPKQRFEVTGLAPDLVRLLARNGSQFDEAAKVFSVSVKSEDQAAPNAPMLGRYRIDEGRLVFEPRFPLRPGVVYCAEFDLSKVSGAKDLKTQQIPVSEDFAIPKRQTEPTIVRNVFPSRDVLPENQLKFYIHFSGPMSRGEAYQRVHLLDESGKPVEGAFLELGEELWDHSATRFTLFFDPGRIKRGLKPREELGPALEEGKSYALVVDGDWLDANGNPLKESFRKSFRVVAPDDTQPKLGNWSLSAPAAGTRQPLTVDFEEPLDRGMLERVLHVVDRDGKPFPSERIEICNEETRWIFHPAKAWKPGQYALSVDSALEDLAGNSLKRLFEVDVFRKIEREVLPERVSLPFEIPPHQ